VQIWNPSVPGQTTRDSYYKYDALRNVPFNLVLVYHGINELRANNAPPDVFRADYSHYAWYRYLNDDHRRTSRQWSLIPETVVWVAIKLQERFGSGLIGEAARHPEWWTFGADYRSAGSFRSNVEAIADLAEMKGEPMALMTFAHYLAPGYTREKFDNRELDYLLYGSPVELWGIPEVVDRGIDVHNEVIRDIAAARPGLLFVDVAALMPNGRRYYNDIVHLTGEGGRFLVCHGPRGLARPWGAPWCA